MFYFIPLTYRSFFQYMTPIEIFLNLLMIFTFGYVYIVLFKKILNKTFPILLQIFLILFYLQGTTSTVGLLIYITIAIILLYYWGFTRTLSFNTISFTLIFVISYVTFLNTSVEILWYWLIGKWVHFKSYATIVSLIFPYFRITIAIILAFLLLKHIRPVLVNYIEFVVNSFPLYGWIINFMGIIFRLNSGQKTYSLFSSPLQATLAIIAFIIVYGMAIYIPTKLLQNKSAIQNQRLELENLSQYTSHIETMYDELRRFRHDYKNILLSLNDAVENRDIDQVSDIFKRVVIPTNVNVETRTSVLGKLTEVKNLEIKSLIYSKTMEAINKGIRVEIEIEKPIKLDTNIQITDMLRTISILFDNAINATLKAKQPQINLSFFEDDDKNTQVFQIGNSTQEELINLSKLSGRFNGVLTNSRRGLGLRNLRSILARYPFIQNNRSSKDYWFEQQIVIYKVSQTKKK